MIQTVVAATTPTLAITPGPDQTSFGQNENVFVFDLTGGHTTIVTLPAISTIIYQQQDLLNGGSVGLSGGQQQQQLGGLGGGIEYVIKGTIIGANFPGTVIFEPARSGETFIDNICGDHNVTIDQIGTSFELAIAGTNTWIMKVATKSTQS